MRSALPFLILLISNLAIGQINFGSRQILNDEMQYSSQATCVHSADLDNDGAKELIVSSFNDDKILWYKNVSGSFNEQPCRIITTNLDTPSAVYAADLDNDGFKDIVACSQYANKTVWFKNLGNGNFSPQSDVGTANYPKCIFSGDTDNDGDSDVVVGLSNTSIVVYYENTGNGNFAAGVNLSASNSNITRVMLRDLNNDGLTDIIYGAFNGGVYYFRRLPNGTYAESAYIGGGGEYGRTFGFIDINNDGFIDMFGQSYNDFTCYYLNQGGNSFSDFHLVGSGITDSNEIQVADMDADGTLDIVMSHYYGEKIGYFRNLNNGTFSTIASITNNLAAATSFNVEDFDGNGFPDVAAISYRENQNQLNKVSVFMHNPLNQYTETPINFYLSPGLKVRIADINNDGNSDIISVARMLLWNENHGDGSFSSYKMISESIGDSSHFVNDFEISDIDNDNIPDFILCHTDFFEIYHNNGNNSFVKVTSIPNSSYFSREIAVADLDGDNLKDLIVSVYDPNKMAWMKNLGNNAFGPMIFLNFPDEEGYRPDKILTGDLDNDGDLDIVSISPELSRIQWLENNDSAASFNIHTFPATHVTRNLALEDYDNDGDLDIFTNQYVGGSIYVYQNNNGVFSDRITVVPLTNKIVDDFYFADLNGDGFKDIVSSELGIMQPYTEKLVCYPNNAGSFGNPVIIDNNPEIATGYVGVGDLNNDGKLDVTTTRNPSGQTAYYLNESVLSVSNNIPNSNGFIIYPVPLSSVLHWTDQSKSTYRITVFTPDGKKIFESKPENANEINLSFLPGGIYLIRFDTANGHYTRKIIKK